MVVFLVMIISRGHFCLVCQSHIQSWSASAGDRDVPWNAGFLFHIFNAESGSRAETMEQTQKCV